MPIIDLVHFPVLILVMVVFFCRNLETITILVIFAFPSFVHEILANFNGSIYYYTAIAFDIFAIILLQNIIKKTYLAYHACLILGIFVALNMLGLYLYTKGIDQTVYMMSCNALYWISAFFFWTNRGGNQYNGA